MHSVELAARKKFGFCLEGVLSRVSFERRTTVLFKGEKNLGGGGGKYLTITNFKGHYSHMIMMIPTISADL